ncbi:MAG: preprotein translocase subunit SecG [Firmicutes bacterium]|nr:preprotein translocase subunit SecG [Bacillota bacterium]
MKRVKRLQTALIVIHVIVCLALIASVLLQSGRSAGLSGAIAGGAQSLFGKKKGMDDLLGRVTTGLAVGFMLLAIALTVLVR